MGAMTAVVSAVLREPFSRRARRELLWCLVGVGVGAVGLAVVVAALLPGTAASVARGVPLLGLVIVVMAASGGARKVTAGYRRLASRLLAVEVPAPPPAPGRFRARLRDPGSWRRAAYVALKVPLAVLEEYALLWWAGVADVTYPFWWGLFRNHDPGVHLRPVAAITPFGLLRISTLPGTVAVFACGAGMVLAAPWVTRAVVAVDRALLVRLLAPGGLARRVAFLEASRTQAAENAAATLRRIERDLHDGAQAQLATLAMKLGQAKEKLGRDPAVPFDRDGALALVDAAHQHAKEALVDLRNIARGIHPPALDVGLDAALATLVARSPVPTTLRVATETRPAPAIETIAYFSVAELLANVARHSGAGHATVDVSGRDGWLRFAVSDDGDGGAEIGAGTGLAGLAERVRAVDGLLRVTSPRGGPTTVVVELPLHA